ncbi:hypothetical protein FPZ24_03685 [Sphingomonas panacisoli]|uniref:Uncharacterized protein n=1 Tax=Sphingomonas panacisoli TaxID=1813879 RepID=A0A5B8LER8_9SPHN|nr:hypothetical protein [Sphingomonas panacisoli]QDZ06688.1 hypothetical protein FPZ24_03685 [Sphingomonas panacisoli]
MLLSIAVMLAAGAALPNYTMPPARRAVPSKCADACAKRYRLSSSDEEADTSKYRALDEDGTDCNVTRSKICRSQPRTWIRADY